MVWIAKGKEYYDLSKNQNIKSFTSIDTIANVFNSSGDLILDASIGIGVFVVLIATHFRIFFGIEFADKDDSFNNAFIQLNESEQKKLSVIMGLVMATLAGISVLQSYAVGLMYMWLMPMLVFIESIIIIIFDIKFSKVLLFLDEQKSTNWMFVINDVVFLVIGCLFVLSPIMSILGLQLSHWIFFVLVFTYILFFIVELFGYWESVKKARREAWQSLLDSTKFLLIDPAL